jgi:hypothetical protein
LIALTALNPAFAQEVGIGTDNPDPAAALEITATDKGLLPPRMTGSERDNIEKPPAGLIIWCTDCYPLGELQVFNGTQWTNMAGGAAAQPPKIGDFMQGGVVFYVVPTPTDLDGDGSLEHGLVCSIRHQTSMSTGAVWGCTGTKISGANGKGIGTGADNTRAIVAGCNDPNSAANKCDNYVRYGNSDWFLPSQDELLQMYQHKATIDSTAKANASLSFMNFQSHNYQACRISRYWSSTQSSKRSAKNVCFNNGNKITNLKGFGNSGTHRAHVRAVRAF